MIGATKSRSAFAPDTKAHANLIICLCTVTYMVSYLTRINYGAVLVEMAYDTGIAKSLLSLAVTGNFITYGAGQILSGILGDKASPKTLVLLALVLTSAMNFLIPFCNSPYVMTAVWCVNGVAQAFMWPPLVKLMTITLRGDDYRRGCTIVIFGSTAGTILIYALSPIIISLRSWRAVFFVCAACGILMTAVWGLLCDDRPLEGPVADKPKKEKSKDRVPLGLLTPLMLGIMLCIIFQGALRDGITTWMPTYISETYKLGSAASILTGVVLPVFTFVCIQLTSTLYKAKLHNPIAGASVFFGVALVSAVPMLLFSGKSAVLSVISVALFAGCMHAVNFLLICLLPQFFINTGRVSTVSGILNACTYVGSAVSTFGIAVVSENAGWSTTLIIWAVIAALGAVICAASIKAWNNRNKAAN